MNPLRIGLTMNSESDIPGEVISLEDYKKRRVETLKKRLRLHLVKSLVKHTNEQEKKEDE